MNIPISYSLLVLGFGFSFKTLRLNRPPCKTVRTEAILPLSWISDLVLEWPQISVDMMIVEAVNRELPMSVTK